MCGNWQVKVWLPGLQYECLGGKIFLSLRKISSEEGVGEDNIYVLWNCFIAS